MPRGPDYQKERSERQQARILDALASGPKTIYQLAECVHLNRSTVHKHLAALTAKPNKRVYVESFILGAGRPKIIYAAGSGRDANIHRFQQERVLEALEGVTTPRDTYEIASMCGIGRSSLKNYMRALRSAGRIHVAEWYWSNKTATPRFVVGRAPDAPRPRHVPKADVSIMVGHASWFAALLPKSAAGMREAV